MISVSRQASFDNSVVYNVLWVGKFSPGTAKCVNLTDDLEIQGYIILHVPLPIKAVRKKFFLEHVFSKGAIL